MKLDSMLDSLRLTRSGDIGEATARLRALLDKPNNTRTSQGGISAQLQSLADKVGHLKMPGLFRDFTPPTPAAPTARPNAEPRTGDSQTFVDLSFIGPAGARTYKLFIPEFRTPGPHPLVVMLHGCTQSPDDFAAGTQMNVVAARHDCFVVYPAQSQSANASKCWNWFQQKDQKRDHGEPGIIAGIVEEIASLHHVDRTRIYIAGLSAGGAAAANIAFLYPDVFAALGVHSGLACGAAVDLPSALTAMSQGAAARPATPSTGTRTPVIVFHGDHDRTVHPKNAEQVLRHAKASGASLATEMTSGRSKNGRGYDIERHTDPQGRILLEKWTVHQAGHAWFGGDASGSYTDPAGPDASAEMMRFFLSHRLDG